MVRVLSNMMLARKVKHRQQRQITIYFVILCGGEYRLHMVIAQATTLGGTCDTNALVRRASNSLNLWPLYLRSHVLWVWVTALVTRPPMNDK